MESGEDAAASRLRNASALYGVLVVPDCEYRSDETKCGLTAGRTCPVGSVYGAYAPAQVCGAIKAEFLRIYVQTFHEITDGESPSPQRDEAFMKRFQSAYLLTYGKFC